MWIKKDLVNFESNDEYLKFQREANHENNYTGTTNRPWINEDLDIVMKYVTNKKSSILSIGTRDFYDLRYLRQHGYENLYGCDLDERSIPLSKQFGFNFTICDIHEYKFPIKFDGIYCRHVLEHCYNCEKALQNMISNLQVNSYIMVVVPLEDKIYLPKKRGHCRFWKTSEEFSNFCKQYLEEVSCIEDTISRKKPQVAFLGRKK